uniref:Uncharacterized protein LOC114338654 n=1 Tax=Diabrotica virgifera virgifera TaxID=50390 RepID=A0A6P7G7G7_DIAVI
MNEMDVKQEIYEDNSSHNSNESKEDGLLLNSLKPIKQEVLEDDSCKRQSNENEDLKWLDCKNGIKTEPHSDINTSSIIGYVDNNCLHQIKTEEDICDIKTEEVEHGEDQDEQMHNEDWNTPLTNYCDNELIKTNKEFHIVSINADCSTIPCQRKT